MLAVLPNSDVVAAPPVAAPDEPKLNTGAVDVAAADEDVVDGAEVKLLPNEKPLLVAGAEEDDELVTVEVAAVAADGSEKERVGAVDEEAAEVDRDDEEDDELRLEPNDNPLEPNRPPPDAALPAAAGAVVEVVELSVPNEKLGTELVDEAAGVPNEKAGTVDEEAAEDDRVEVEPNIDNDRYTRHPYNRQ